jgi:hypothetical protein
LCLGLSETKLYLCERKKSISPNENSSIVMTLENDWSFTLSRTWEGMPNGWDAICETIRGEDSEGRLVVCNECFFIDTRGAEVTAVGILNNIDKK